MRQRTGRDAGLYGDDGMNDLLLWQIAANVWIVAFICQTLNCMRLARDMRKLKAGWATQLTAAKAAVARGSYPEPGPSAKLCDVLEEERVD